jgi:hypothetical protein
VNVRVLFAWEDLATRQGEWRELAARCRALPEWTPAWCIPWWRELGRGRLRAVAASDDDGTLVGLGLFCESRAPGPKLLTALGRGDAPAVGMLVLPNREEVVFDLLGAAVGSAPAVMVLAGTDDGAMIEKGAAEHGLSVSSRPHPPARLVDRSDLAAAIASRQAVAGGTGTGTGTVAFGSDLRRESAGLDALTRALGFEPGPDTARRRERAFLVTVLDSFTRSGDLVWPIVTDGERLVATSAWLVHGERASLWLRWTADGTATASDADVAAALAQLESRGVRDVVVRAGHPLGQGGAPIGGETVLVHNRPGLRRLEALAWAVVRARS